MSPRVTIVTVTFNRAHVLRNAVESVLDQDYPELRLLVIDDGSTDGTEDLLQEYQDDPRLQVVRHQSNLGVLAARNTALSHITPETKYFGYVDSDDVLLPGAVTTLVEAIEPHGDHYSMVCAWCREATTGQPQGHFPAPSGDFTLDDYVSGRMEGDFTELVRWDLAQDTRYDARAGGGEGMLLTHVLRSKPGLLIPDQVKLMDRSGADRVSHVRYDPARAEARMWLKQYVLASIGPDLRARYPERYVGLLQDLAKWAAIAGDGKRARRAGRQALRVEMSFRSLLVACFTLVPTGLARPAAQMIAYLRGGDEA